MKQIILASASPRRKELLEKTGLKFTIHPANHPEIINEKLSPTELAKQLSLEKALVVAKNYKDAVIISADTLVVCDGKIFGKPKDKGDAKRMLKILNGKIHKVITAFTIYDLKTNRQVTKSAESKILFNKVSEKEIEKYIELNKPFDKAGAYGIQELPKTFVKKVVGDYDNIVGLPVRDIVRELRKFKVAIS